MAVTPQPGIFALGTRSHHHLQLDARAGVDGDALLRALGSIRDLATTIIGVNIVVGLGADLCRRVLPEHLPADLAPFSSIVGTAGNEPVTMPADQHDLWIWLHAAGPDAVFDTARAVHRSLDGLAQVVAEDDHGEELEVFRRSIAFGGVMEHGLMFVAFSADSARLTRMLHRMVGEGDGFTDRLTDFSRSTGGGWYVAPPVEAFAAWRDGS